MWVGRELRGAGCRVDEPSLWEATAIARRLAPLVLENEQNPSCRVAQVPGTLPRPSFSLYDLRMFSDEPIQEWADEARAGYDPEKLRRRGRGRPGRGAEPSQVIAVRLTPEELAGLDAAAERDHVSRSEAIRRALAGYAA